MLSYVSYTVKVFMPTVLQGFHCQIFGHEASVCRKEQPRCARCEGFHYVETCLEDKPSQCSNSKGNHEARSSECPIKGKQIQVTKVRIRQGVTLGMQCSEKGCGGPGGNALPAATEGPTATVNVPITTCGPQKMCFDK